MATSNTAPTTPTVKSAQPKRVNSRTTAFTQLRLKISAPILFMLVNRSATASKTVL